MSISIITVSFNSEKTIVDTILSVLNQTIAPYEYFIIDGKSTDATVTIAQKHRERFKQRGIKYRIVSEKDQGIYDAMNKGISMVNGEIIGMINSDDWYEKDALEQVEKKYSKNKFDMLYGDLRVIRKNGRSFIKRSFKEKFVTSRHWNHPTTFITKELYEKYQYDLREPLYADFDLFLRLRKENIHIEILNKVLANYRLGGVSTKKDFKRAMDDAKQRYEIYRRNGYGKIYFFECYFIEFAKYLLV